MNSQNKNFKEGIRTSEGEQPPKDWKSISLGEVLDEVDHRVKDAGSIDIPVLSMTRHQGLILQKEKFEKRVASRNINNYKVVRKKQIVYGFPMDEGVIFTLKKFDLGAVSPVYEVWNLSSENVNIDFLDELLRTPLMISTYRRLTSNTVQRRRIVSKRDFKRIIIPLPPLPEQIAIARVLSTIQKAVEAQDKIIAAAGELKKSLMRHLFTYGPVPIAEAEQVPLKETEIGPVPEHWEVVTVGDVVSTTQYGISLRGKQKGKYPIIRMNSLIDGRVNDSDLQYVDLENENFEKFRVNKGDILFNRTNSYELVGKTALFELEGDYVFASYLVKVVANPLKLFPWYLNYYLNCEGVQDRLRMLATRAVSQSNINATKLRGFRVPLAPIPEQREIAQALMAVDDKIKSEQKHKAALQTLFKTILHLLMTGKVRIKELEDIAS